MKKALFLLSVAILVLSSCQTKPETKAVNAEAEKAAIDSLFMKLSGAMNSKDANAASTLMTEDFVSYGTDPSELFYKKELMESWQKAFADTALKIEYTVDKRNIKLSANGQSAIVVEQYMMAAISNKVMTRTVSHVVKENDKWMIDFISWNFIPKNEEIALIDKALEMPVAKK